MQLTIASEAEAPEAEAPPSEAEPEAKLLKN